MNAESRIVLPRIAVILAAAALVVVGAAAMFLLLELRAPSRTDAAADAAAVATRSPSSSATVARPDEDSSPLPDVRIPLTADAVKRAGIVVSRVSTTAIGAAAELRLPGVVAANAYRQVVVTPLVAGRVTAVSVQLGDRVRRGQTIAQVYSPELAEARTRYVSALAMLEAHDRELRRTQKLVEIGAASRQELERIHAEHAAQTAAVESARAQLQLLGGASALKEGDADKVNAATPIPAPIDGVITERAANVGLNVDSATTLFTVVDLSTVWILADLHERDMGRIRVGTAASITSDAFSGRRLDSRISYIDPQLESATRTAKARIELRNPSGQLRLGMYVDVVVAVDGAGSTPTIPRSAVQNVGNRAVVYLADTSSPGTFVEREVRLGQVAGEDVEVVEGVQPGDLIVTAGSFSIRAERERLGR
jgi:RND family efflux transporter MFP subunit